MRFVTDGIDIFCPQFSFLYFLSARQVEEPQTRGCVALQLLRSTLFLRRFHISTLSKIAVPGFCTDFTHQLIFLPLSFAALI
jgi:hypothetical protein